MIKAIFFDSNNTLENFNSITVKTNEIISSVASFFTSNTIDVKEAIENLEFLSENFSKTAAWINHPIFWRGILKGKHKEEVLRNVYSAFLMQYGKYIELFPEAINVLKALKKRDIKLFLIANGNYERLDVLINKFHLNDYFDDFLISGETPYKKPEPFMFQYLLKKHNLKCKEVVMIGDRLDNDVKGANSNELTSVYINRYDNWNPVANSICTPDFIIYNLYSLLNIIDNYKKNNRPKKNESFEIKNAIILAGGKGTRLGELGKTINKNMLEVDKVPLLNHLVDSFKSVGVNCFVIPVSHLSEQIIDYFGDGSKFNISIKYVQGHFSSTSEALKECLKYVSDTFYYCHGNILFQNSIIADLAIDYKSHKKDTILYTEQWQNVSHLKFNKITNNEIADTKFNSKGRYTYLGLSIYNKNTLEEYLQKDTMSELFIEKAIRANIPIRAIEADGYLFHLETEKDFENINETINI